VLWKSVLHECGGKLAGKCMSGRTPTRLCCSGSTYPHARTQHPPPLHRSSLSSAAHPPYRNVWWESSKRSNSCANCSAMCVTVGESHHQWEHHTPPSHTIARTTDYAFHTPLTVILMELVGIRITSRVHLDPSRSD